MLVPCQRQQRRRLPGAASSSWRRYCGVKCSYGFGRKSCDDGACGRHSTFLKVSRKPMLQSTHLRPPIPSSTFVRHPSIRHVFVLGVVPRCRPCCCACSSPSHSGHCAAVSLVLLVLFRFIFALRRRKMPPQLANRSRIFMAELPFKVHACHSLVVDAPLLRHGCSVSMPVRCDRLLSKCWYCDPLMTPLIYLRLSL